MADWLSLLPASPEHLPRSSWDTSGPNPKQRSPLVVSLAEPLEDESANPRLAPVFERVGGGDVCMLGLCPNTHTITQVWWDYAKSAAQCSSAAGLKNSSQVNGGILTDYHRLSVIESALLGFDRGDYSFDCDRRIV